MNSAPAKIVARFRDGRVWKGHTINFQPDGPAFDLKVVGTADGDEPFRVRLSELKAVFFVKDFEGNPARNDQSEFPGAFTGRRVQVRFADGESITGTTFGYDAARDGFFLFPADPSSNNIKIYVLFAAVQEVVRLKHGVAFKASVSRK